jgi:LuxR family maltose regulon positive regulatory protein
LAGIGIQPGLRQSFVLVIDDAHVVSPNLLKEAVLGVLDWLPERSQLAIASRGEPALALGGMRAKRMVVEIRGEDLSMSVVEAASLLRKVGVDLDFTSVQTLVRRTQGWPAALELAALSGAQRPENGETPDQLRGDDHLMSEFFRTELLTPLSPSTVRFLMRSSVLDRLSGALCDKVLERKRSASVLAELARGGVPLQPIDANHEWYRLHDLFREMLQTELRRAEPETRRALHGRAADWHRTAGDLDRAIGHARSAGDLDGAAELLWANLFRYLGQGRNDMVQGWLSGVTAEQLTGCGRLALVAGHSQLALGNVAVAEQRARTAAVSFAVEGAASTTSERAGVVIIEAWAARSGAKRMGEDAKRAYDLLLDDSPWRATCCFLRGTAALLTGDAAEAERDFEEATARGNVAAPDAAALSLAQMAVLTADRDQHDDASDFAWRARSLIDEHALGKYPTSALVFAVCSAAAMHKGRVDLAKAAVAQCLGLVELIDDSVSWYGAEVRMLVARVSLALGDAAAARELLAEASRLARRARDVVIFKRWFDDAWNQFDRRAEAALAGVATLTTAELRVLRFLPTHYSFQEIALRLHVSANTVKTHVHAVYRKLDVSSRSEAVARATHLGLLGS